MTDERDMSALDAALTATKEAAAQVAEASGSGNKGDSKKSQATELADIANEIAIELWEDRAGDAWITFPVDDHHEHWKIKSGATRRWLRGEYFRRHQKAVGSQGMQDALGLLEAHAHEARQRHETYVRVAELEGRIYIDLCDADWNAVEIRPGSWEVVRQPPVRFRRARGMLDLPIPAAEGDLNELRRFVNVAGDDDWHLLVAWLLAAWRAKGPYPALVLRGEQGSAKSTTANILRTLVDPNVSPLRAEPKELRDLMIAATNSWCVAFDNLSRLPFWLSDSLCRLATGGGFAVREHYENDQEILFNVKRPALITGIEDVVTNADLLDRTLTIDLPRIPEERRRTEEDFWAEFDAACPRILSGIFTGLCRTLAVGPVKPNRTPRMADFAAKAVAAERALGWPAGSFLDAYQGNRETARETALEDSTLAALIRKRAEEGGFTGTASDLLKWLNTQVGEEVRRQPSWPKQPHRLSGLLRRLMTDLRDAGWAMVEMPPRRGGGRRLVIRKADGSAGSKATEVSKAPSAVPARPSGDATGSRGDATPGTSVTRVRVHSEYGGDASDAGDATFPPFSSQGPPARDLARPDYPKGVTCQACRGLGWDWDAGQARWRCHGCGGPLLGVREWRG
jgi:hypothetical protein